MNPPGLPQLRIVVLAAGFSSRLREPKPLARVGGVTLLRRTLRLLTGLGARAPVIVVVPRASGRLRLGQAFGQVAFVANPGRAAGLSSSVRLGLRRARYASGILLLPVDLAGLTRRDLERLAGRWRGAPRSVAACDVRGRPGTPLILPHWLRDRAQALAGDQGLRGVVRGLPGECVRRVRMRSALSDVDTRADLDRARRRLRAP